MKIFRTLATYWARARSIGLGQMALKLICDLRTSTSYSSIGPQSELIHTYFSRARSVPGAFNLDDTNLFTALLRVQSLFGFTGDVLEIGSYHGRSASLMSISLEPGERLVLCDPFDQVSTADHYRNKPAGAAVIDNILTVNPDFPRPNIEVHPVLSSELQLDQQRLFRFIHIDGGHSAAQTYADLAIAEKHLDHGGIIAIDDYKHPAWPGVAEGLEKYMKGHTKLTVILDANRHGAYGRKVYLGKSSDSCRLASPIASSFHGR